MLAACEKSNQQMPIAWTEDDCDTEHIRGSPVTSHALQEVGFALFPGDGYHGLLQWCSSVQGIRLLPSVSFPVQCHLI